MTDFNRNQPLFQNADWVDTDEQEPVELVVESCDGVINEYRKYYDPAAPQDELYNDVAALHFAKEAASVTESYGELAERTLRRHEGMVGFLGSKFSAVRSSICGYFLLAKPLKLNHEPY